MNNQKVVLAIMDGWGIRDEKEGNAIKEANTPNFDMLCKTYPHTKIYAEGEHVGLPAGQMGNSEVGHLNLGAGRIVFQELSRINNEIKTGNFFKNEAFLKAADHVKKYNSALHIYGLVSPGGVHSSMDHIFALIDFAKKENIKNFYVHAFLDGRDTPPQSAVTYLKEVEEKLKENGFAPVATVSGRYYAMDRDNRWDRVEKAYDALTSMTGEKASSAVEAVEKSYAAGTTDEFVLPTIIGDENSRIKDNDAIIFFNFRPDRAREITRAFTQSDFNGFERKVAPKNLFYVTMTQYDETFTLDIAFKPEHMTNILGEVLSKNGIRQLRTAETEKYAHVTFFFNGGEEKPFENEERILVKSPKVPTYDMQPEMSAYEVKDNVLKALDSDKYGVIIVNFANPDMVGHTGVESAAIKAIEAVDTCIGEIVQKVVEKGYVMYLTADHGNAECMIDPKTKKPFTAHTTNMVPFIAINLKDKNAQLRDGASLCDVAPTILKTMDIEQPEEMTGKSILI